MNDQMHMFIECHFPTRACNFRCDYCYVTQNRWWAEKKPNFEKCLSGVSKAFDQKRLGGICMVNICATGETLLYPESVTIIRSILEAGHYVMVVTNGTLTARFKDFCEFPSDFRSRLFFKFSFHFLELKKRGLLDLYFENIKMVQRAGISFTVELTPDDEYIPHIPEIKKSCLDNLGALCHVTVCRDECREGFPLLSKLPMDQFVAVWRDFDSELFSFKSSIFGIKRREFCYAGKWGLVVDLENGSYQQCYRTPSLGDFYDLTKPLKLIPVGKNCPEGHCFNGHAFLGFGLIPGLDTTDYADMRDRSANGEHWLAPRMEEFMRTKLWQNNKQYNGFQKVVFGLSPRVLLSRFKGFARRVLKDGKNKKRQ